MKRKLRGIKRSTIELDFDLYRVNVPIPGVANANLSVIDIWPEGVDKTVLFVHGYAGCAETWEHQINYFSRSQRVVVPDLRGHGQSDAPLTRYTMPELVADLYAITQNLELPAKFVLVGHSFGGSICLEYAVAHPEQVERLVLIATAAQYPLPRLARWAFSLPTAFYRLWWDYRPRWNAEPHVMKRMAINNMRKWQAGPLLGRIQMPTLLITGERDSYFPRYVFQDLSQQIPNAEVQDVGAAKHKVQLERHRAVNRAIERFIYGGKRGSWRDQQMQDSAVLGRRVWLASYGEHVPSSVPIPRRPVFKFLESAADWVPHRPATLFFNARLTYQQLNKQANQFAHALHGLGINPGDRVMLALPNVPQFVVAYFGVLKAGGVVVLPNPEADAGQLVRQIEHTQSKILVTLRDFGSMVTAALTETSLKLAVLADVRNAVSGGVYKKLMARWGIAAPGDGELANHPRCVALLDLLQDAATTPLAVKVSSDDLAAIIYTSGTTDEPKGVCLTHYNLVANTVQTRHWIQNMRYGQEVFLAVVPLMHSYGLTTALHVPVALGATVVLQPVFELEQVLEQIKQHNVTVFPGVPAMIAAISQAPNVRDFGLDHIKACISGASPLPVEVQESFEKLTRSKLMEGYGLTEASPVTHGDPLYGTRKVGSIGLPIPNTDAKIVDLTTDDTLPPGHIGELVVRGPQVMRSYWADAAATAAVLKNGWLYTGDVAVMDSDGYFQIISRKRDTIMAGDFSVYPRDIEEVLYENSKVLEAAVVGVPAASGDGQRVKAFVVPRPGTTLSKEELLDLCRRRLDEYAVPWDIEFREELPKSFIGKVLRRMLVE
ncbi:MAG: 2-succinylbenzoate--CoA ligase [Anaerolineae bacterium]|nr:2-succinylbenzoate--CoA ligase [Anaerolineae bacterium]